MDLTQANIRDVVKTFKAINMANTSLALSEDAPLGLCVDNPLYYFISEELKPPHGYDFLERGMCIEGAILGATDFSHGKFRPPGANEYIDIRCYGKYAGYIDRQAKTLNELVRRLSSARERVDISALFEAGEYDINGKPAKVDIRSNTKSTGLSSNGQETVAVFRTESKPEKIFTISVDLMRGLRDLGFVFEGLVFDEINGPVILMWSDLLRAVGMMTEFPQSGIVTSPDGRKMSSDAIEISWWPESKALAAVESEIGYFRPVRYGTSGKSISPDEVVRDRLHVLSKAVSALRWRGYPEDQIMKILNTRQWEAWLDIHQEILKRAQDKLDQALGGLASVPYLKNQTKQLCEELERLQEVMYIKGNPDRLDYGALPRLVQVVKEMEHEK